MSIEAILRRSPAEQPGAKFRRAWDTALAEAQEKIAQGNADAMTFVGAAEARLTLWCFGFEPRARTLPQASDDIKGALRLKPDLIPAHVIGAVLDMADWQWPKAVEGFKRAFALESKNAVAHHWVALFLAAMGRHDLARDHAEMGVTLNASPGRLIGLAAIHYFAHRFDEMEHYIKRALTAAPGLAPAQGWLGRAYVQLGRHEDAIAAFLRGAEQTDGLAEMLGGLGHACALAGRRDDARAILRHLDICAEHNYVPPIPTAGVAIALGDADRAFELLEQACREQSWELVFARVDPIFVPLQSEPRFLAILQRINFPPQPKAERGARD